MRGFKSVAATMNWGVHTKPALDEMVAEMGVGAPKHRPCPFRLLMFLSNMFCLLLLNEI